MLGLRLEVMLPEAGLPAPWPGNLRMTPTGAPRAGLLTPNDRAECSAQTVGTVPGASILAVPQTGGRLLPPRSHREQTP